MPPASFPCFRAIISMLPTLLIWPAKRRACSVKSMITTSPASVKIVGSVPAGRSFANELLSPAIFLVSVSSSST
ncbi:hypothetical protein GGI35DRAFT_442815 [Trichoderma velutinum]